MGYRRAVHRVMKSFNDLFIAGCKRKKQTSLRMWIEENPHIHALNYLYYRHLTKSFENWLIDKYVK